MPPVTSYFVPTEKTSPLFAAAFAAGCGGDVAADDALRPGDVAMFGSVARWDVLLQARREGRSWYYCDHAYFGRFHYYRVTRNAFQHDGAGEADLNLPRRHGVAIKPWQPRGAHILVCPPDRAFEGLMIQAGVLEAPGWGSRTVDIMRRHTDRPIVVRDRSQAGQRPLAQDLQDCWALVTFMSNAAIEAAMAGIPVFATGPCAARAIGRTALSQIEDPIYPERHQFAANLLAQQWTMQEIADGTCWRALQARRIA